MSTTNGNGTPRFLTARQVGGLLGVSARTIWRWASQGLIPAPVRLTNRTTRWDRAALDQWVSSLDPRPPAA
jgi:prophage regulatory protein